MDYSIWSILEAWVCAVPQKFGGSESVVCREGGTDCLSVEEFRRMALIFELISQTVVYCNNKKNAQTKIYIKPMRLPG